MRNHAGSFRKKLQLIFINGFAINRCDYGGTGRGGQAQGRRYVSLASRQPGSFLLEAKKLLLRSVLRRPLDAWAQKCRASSASEELAWR